MKMIMRIAFLATALRCVLLSAANAQPVAVDMGLSVKWADRNLGADAPESYGDYFAWGETAPKENYSWNTYAWGNGAMTKYAEGFILNRQLDAEDDAAQVRLGCGWRMPTFTEVQELVYQCDWLLVSQNGVTGYKVTSKATGESIFLPAAGYMEGTKRHFPGTAGRYWSATRHPYHPQCGMNIFFSEEFYYAYFYGRFRGYPIRPVIQGDDAPETPTASGLP